MNNITITSLFVLFAIVAGIGAIVPDAFVDHSEVTIETALLLFFFILSS